MKLSKEIVVHTSADRAWQIVAHDFARIGEWASGVAKSVPNKDAIVLDGATVGGRVCSVPGFGNIHETFTAYDEHGKTFTYEATGMPFFVKGAFNSWKIEAIDENTSRVSFSVDMHLVPVIGGVMGIPMRMQLDKLLREAVEELKYYAETGEVHPRKQKLIAEQAPQYAIS